MALPQFEHLSLGTEGEVLVVTLDRPPANAMSAELLEEGTALAAALREEPPKAIVLTGAGRFFSGGMDLKLAPDLAPDDQARTVNGINSLFDGWYSLPRPVIAAVNGHAVAGGLILALCADLRVCAGEASLGLTEARVGLPYPVAAMAVVKAELRPETARRLVLEAALIDGERGLEMGVVDEVVPVDEVLPRAMELGSEMAKLPTGAYETVKWQLRGATIEAMRAAIPSDPLVGEWASDETATAAAAVLDKGG